jgi:hypothetical protein
MRGASTANRGKVATRGGANIAHKNVFQSRNPPKKRGNLLQNAMDAAKAPKNFSNIRLRRKAELQARDIAEKAPDISALPGGLFDPSNPSSFVPIRPEILRKSSNMVPLAETDSERQPADLDALFLSRENTPVAEDPWGLDTTQAPPVERKFDILRSTCFYWDRHQKDSNQPPCQRGVNCKFQHYRADGMPIAPRPNTQGADDSWGKHNSPSVAPVEYTLPGAERATCYYWDRAEKDSSQPSCSKGAFCKFKHYYEEGMPIALRPSHLKSPHLKFSDETRDAQDTRDSVTSDRPPWRKDPITDNTSQDLPSLPPWRQGSGDMAQAGPAQMAPQGAITPMAVAPDLQDILHKLRTTADSNLASPKAPSAQSPSQSDPPSAPTIRPRPPWNPRDPQNAICHFWATQGTCNWGDSCKYLHSNDPDLPVAPSPKEQRAIRKEMSDTNAYGRETCRFWLKDACKYSNETCRFWHGPQSAKIQAGSAVQDQACEQIASPTVQAPPTGPRVKSVSFAIDGAVPFVEEPESISSSNQRHDKPRPHASPSAGGKRHPYITCPFWAQGDCHHGSNCWYRHAHPDGREPNHDTQDVEMQDRIETERLAPVPIFPRPSLISDPMMNSRSVTIGESFSSIIDEANIAPQAISKRSAKESSEIPNPILHSPVVAPKAKRPKMSMDDYRRKKTSKELGSRAKEVTFGLDETQSLLLDFGDMTKTLELPWGFSFSGISNVRFDQMCMAQDFQGQQGFIQRLGLWHGNLVPADVGDAEATRSIDNAADELIVRSAGLLSTFPNFLILTFPSKRGEWRFLESTFEHPQDARLRYFIFQPNIVIRRSLEMKPTSLAIGAPYRNMLVDKVHELDFKTLLPLSKRPQKTPNFYLLFPSTAYSVAEFVVSWLRSSNRNCKIYSSQSEGSWHFFTQTPEIDTGSILVHESAAAELDRLPNLYSMATTKNFAFWCISESSSPYSIFPSTYGLDDSIMGQLTAIRLFPHGCAFLLTPSFLVAEPELACEVLKWFLTGPQPKYSHSTPRTWKLVCCHNFTEYVLELANSKAAEKDSLELKYRDNLAKDAILDDKGLSFPQCRLRYKLSRMLVEFESKRSLESASEGFESDCDDSDYPFIHADKRIDPDDEKLLVEWFAGWSMRNLDMYKKFVVIGSSTAQLSSRMRRMKEFTTKKETVAESPKVTIPSLKKFSLTNKSTPSPLESPRSPMTSEKHKALAVAAKIPASSPGRAASSSRDLEQNAFEDVVIRPQQESRRNSSLSKASHPQSGQADSNPTSHGINPQLHPNILSFSAITGANAKDAEHFLSKANNDVRAAVDMYNADESVEGQIMELIATERSKQLPRLVTADADAARAQQLYDSPSTTTPAPLQGSKPDARSPPQFDGADDHNMYSSMGFDGTDDRPASSGTESSRTSRSGIQTDDTGRRFVPRSVRLDSSVRKEIPVRPGYIPPEDGEFYQIPSRRGSAAGTPNQSAIASPMVGDRMDIDSEGGGSVKQSRRAESEREPGETGTVLKEIKFEPTMAWYKKLREKGGGWEHILVASYEVALHKAGIGMKS